MKLNSIEIKNFLHVKEAHINFKPVNMFIGDNGNGKSSAARDAICFALTGKVTNRGYTKKNQAGQLKNRYTDGDMSVVLTTDEGVISKNAKTGTSLDVIKPDLAEIMCNPQTVLTMKPAERQKVFSAILQSDDAADKIKELLSVKNGWTPEIQKICLKDLDEAQKWAVEQRRIANRSIKDIQEVARHKPDGFIEISGHTVDFIETPMTITEVDDVIDRRELERDKLIKNQVYNENIDDVTALAALHKKERDEFPSSEKLKADHKDRQQDLVRANKAYNEIDSQIGQLKAEVNV